MGNVSYKSPIKSEKQGYIGKLLCCGVEGERGETLGGRKNVKKSRLLPCFFVNKIYNN